MNRRNYFLFNSDSFLVVFDSGVSSTSTSYKGNFVEGIFVPISGITISDITSGLEVEGYGIASWNFYSQKGDAIVINIEKVLYIPNIPTSLISPQQIWQ